MLALAAGRWHPPVRPLHSFLATAVGRQSPCSATERAGQHVSTAASAYGPLVICRHRDRTPPHLGPRRVAEEQSPVMSSMKPISVTTAAVLRRMRCPCCKGGAGTEDISETDRAAASKVLNLLAANAATSDKLHDSVQSPAASQRGSERRDGGGGSAGAVGAVMPSEVGQRCEGTVGDWCGRYLTQEPIPAKASPQTLATILGCALRADVSTSWTSTRTAQQHRSGNRTVLPTFCDWAPVVRYAAKQVPPLVDTAQVGRRPTKCVPDSGAPARQQGLPGRLQQRRRCLPGGLRVLPVPRRLDRRRLHRAPAAAVRQEVRDRKLVPRLCATCFIVCSARACGTFADAPAYSC